MLVSCFGPIKAVIVGSIPCLQMTLVQLLCSDEIKVDILNSYGHIRLILVNVNY